MPSNGVGRAVPYRCQQLLGGITLRLSVWRTRGVSNAAIVNSCTFPKWLHCFFAVAIAKPSELSLLSFSQYTSALPFFQEPKQRVTFSANGGSSGGPGGGCTLRSVGGFS